MKTNQGFRHHARFFVRWPATYWNEGVLFGQGTLLDISQVACRFAGTMLVVIGMVLKAQIAPPQREDPLYVGEGRVLSATGYNFGLELRGLSTTDQRWLIGFLHNAERRNSFRQIGQVASVEDLAAMPLALPLQD
jgi:hypothetical protein